MISTLAPQQQSKARALIWDTMPARRTRFTSAIQSYLEWLRDQPPPDRIVGQGPNRFFQHHGIYSTSYPPAPITHPDPSPLPSTLNDVPSKPKPRQQKKKRQSTSCPPPKGDGTAPNPPRYPIIPSCAFPVPIPSRGPTNCLITLHTALTWDVDHHLRRMNHPDPAPAPPTGAR